MPQEVIDFINSQFISVLAVEMLDGRPHGATVHFAFHESPPMFLFETLKKYKKSESILKNTHTRASVVIGFDESLRKSLQMDGEIKLLNTDTELLMFKKTYISRFPKKADTIKDPEFIFFAFTPTWWRYTDWDSPGGKKILTSEDR